MALHSVQLGLVVISLFGDLGQLSCEVVSLVLEHGNHSILLRDATSLLLIHLFRLLQLLSGNGQFPR